MQLLVQVLRFWQAFQLYLLYNLLALAHTPARILEYIVYGIALQASPQVYLSCNQPIDPTVRTLIISNHVSPTDYAVLTRVVYPHSFSYFVWQALVKLPPVWSLLHACVTGQNWSASRQTLHRLARSGSSVVIVFPEVDWFRKSLLLRQSQVEGIGHQLKTRLYPRFAAVRQAVRYFNPGAIYLADIHHANGAAYVCLTKCSGVPRRDARLERWLLRKWALLDQKELDRQNGKYAKDRYVLI